jgi:hypothetical protein
LGDRDQEDHSSKSAQVVRPYLEKKPSKKGLLEWLSPKKKKKSSKYSKTMQKETK